MGKEYLDHKKEQIDKTLSVFWAIYMFIIMAYSTGLSFMMESSCLEMPSKLRRTVCSMIIDLHASIQGGWSSMMGIFRDQRSLLASVSKDMNKSVLEFISMFGKFNNNSDLQLTDLKISGTDWYESAWRGPQELVYSWSGMNNTRIFSWSEQRFRDGDDH